MPSQDAAGSSAGPQAAEPSDNVASRVREIARDDRRYTIEAYQFVFEALDHAMVRLGKHRRRGPERHLSVAELLDGMRSFAIRQYGPLARLVLEHMGIHDTADFGEVVFNLVDKGLLNKQDADCKEAFAEGFSFREAFDEGALAEPSY